jgi:hypothetical protein
MNQAKCTTCGAGLTIKRGDKTCVCEYCQSTNIVENALALGKVEVDVTEDIKRLRENLTIFVQQNSIDEILRVSQKLLDWIPQDFVALYFFGYAKQQQNQPRFLYDFYKEAPLHTEEDLKIVAHHLMRYSELRDKVRVITFFEVHAPKLVKQYEQIHKEREDQEDHYANIPRDIFVCFSSFDVEIAHSVVEELEADGNTCWISTRNLRPEDAENYWNNIENAIRNTSLFVVISSANSMRSKDVHQEIEFAQKHQSRMIEFKIDDAPHNTLFKHVFDGNKWVKGSKESNQSYKNLLQRVFEEKALPSPTPTKQMSAIVASSKPINKGLLGGIAGVIVLAIGLFLFMNSGGVDVTLNGSSSLVLSVGETYQELGAVAQNSRNEAFPVDIIGTVNVSRPGNYSVIYRATDSSGRVVEAERLIQVVDTTAPQITLSGDASKTLILGEFYEDPGASAVDNVDGVVTVSVQGAVNTAVPGTYRIEYSAKDNAGNQSTLITRTILVRIPTMDDLLSRAFTVITMDINPTIVIFLDSSDRVLGVESLNDDAEDVLRDYSYLNQNVDQVIDAVISRSQEYLKDEVILIGVQSTSESKQDLISTRVETQIERSSVTYQTPITPIIRTLTLNANELRPVLRQEQPTPARQEYVNELVQVGKLTENANVIVNRTIREITTQRETANVDNILNDKIPPVIRLQGNPNQNISLNGTYIEYGATVTDNYETNLQASVTGSVDTSTAGVYILTYTARDTAGNEAIPVTRTINVGSASATTPPAGGGSSSGGSSSGGSTGTTPPVTPPVVTPPVVTPPSVTTPPVTPPSSAVGTPSDSVPPVITLNGASSITLEVGSTYNELGATLTDNVDSGLSVNITGVVNTGVIGTYTITYTASDRAGNAATPRTRTIQVVDTTRPTIALNGSSNIILEQGQTYVEQGATVSDNYDQNLTAQISGSINTNTIGTYTITYNATDSSNNSAIPVTRTIQVIAVEVVNTNPPFIEANFIELVSPLSPNFYTRFGKSIATNSKYLAVASNESFLGETQRVYVYEKSTGNRVQFVMALGERTNFIDSLYFERPSTLGSDSRLRYQRFGDKILMNEDYIVISARTTNIELPPPMFLRPRVGAVLVFNLNTNESRVILPPFLNQDTYFGHDIAIHGDYIVISAIGRNNSNNSTSGNKGVAWLYKFSDLNFIREIGRGTVSETDIGYEYGSSVAIHGNLILVSEPDFSNRTGIVNVYEIRNQGLEIVRLTGITGNNDFLFGLGNININENLISIHSLKLDKTHTYNLSQRQAGGEEGVTIYNYSLNQGVINILEKEKLIDGGFGAYGYYHQLQGNLIALYARGVNEPGSFYYQVLDLSVNSTSNNRLKAQGIMSSLGNYAGGSPHLSGSQLFFSTMSGSAATTNSKVNVISISN